MFNAAPGKQYFDEISDFFEANGRSLTMTARGLSGVAAFNTLYPSYLTTQQFTTTFLATLGLQGVQEANDYILGQANAGVNWGQIILQAEQLLLGTNSATYAQAKALLQNRIEVATYYTITEGQSSTNFHTLQDVLVGVTSDHATVVTAEARINEQAHVGLSYELKVGIDTLLGTTGNDFFYATNASLNSFDSVNGNAGMDTFSLVVSNDAGSIGDYVLPTSVSMTSIEKLIVEWNPYDYYDGLYADVSNWTGLTTMTVVNTGDYYYNTTDITTKSNVTNLSVTGGGTVQIEDIGTTDTLATVSLDGVNGYADIYTNALTTLNLSNYDGYGVYIDAAAGTRTLAVNLSNVSDTYVEDETATTLSFNVTGTAASDLDIYAESATTINIAGSKALEITYLDTAALTSINGSTDTGGITVDSTLGNKVAFTGGSGADKVEIGATTVAINMGAGNDTVIFDTAVLGTGGLVNGGDGTDTLVMTAANAVTASASTKFNGVVSNFEHLTLTTGASGGATNTVNLTNLNGANYVTTVGQNAGTTGSPEHQTVALTGTLLATQTASLTFVGQTVSYVNDGTDDSAATVATTLAGLLQTSLNTAYGAGAYTVTAPGSTVDIQQNAPYSNVAPASFGSSGSSIAANVVSVDGVASMSSTLALTNMANAGTVVLTSDNAGLISIGMKDASGTADTINLKLTGAGAIVGGTISVAGVETVSIVTDDTNTTPTGITHSLTLMDASATTITVSGDAGLNLVDTGTAITSLDASGITKGGFSWTTGALTSAATIKGSATGANNVDWFLATKAVTYTGGTGVDFVETNGANNTISTGAGADVVYLGDGANTVDLGAGNDIIDLGMGLNTVTGGAGADYFEVYVNLNGNTYTTITDAGTGDQLSMYGTGNSTFNTAKITLADTAVFQDFLDASTSGTSASADNIVRWFQFGGNTYVVEDRSNATTFQNGFDMVVRLTGAIDLSTASWSDANGALTLA
ncbi:hypothetical protein [Ramlibacter sp.]|uniref:hypothetical protein n=1 Tax=Ramlibacter sp. TaxID=1917967 RepID=UPI0017D05914|nr:hypothetical protein [Ramlibacter sp.]MBA2673516.1 hypothetical protein [Ramlibacter sp.]